MKNSKRIPLRGKARFGVFLIAASCAAAALFSCRSVQTSTVKDTVADAAAFSGVKLKMAGDQAQSEISATFSFTTDEFKPGDNVELRWDVVRTPQEVKINCSALRGSDSVTLQGDGKSGSFKKKVDKKLFDFPYEPAPNGDAKANMDKLMAAGGPLRVEGCLMRSGGGAVLATAKGPASPAKETGLGLAEGDFDPPIVQFGKLCAERLGALPAFNCLDETQFKIMDVTVTDENGTLSRPEQAVSKCDRPIYLPTGGGYCKPWARVGRIKVNDTTMAGVVCRRYWSSNYPPISGPNDPIFNDVAVIEHNKKTGETCFFQALGALYGERVPPPNELEVPADVLQKYPQATAAKDFWLTPGQIANINCIGCHDADPWMHSPYIDQAKTEDGDTWLPSSPRSKYVLIGGKFGFKKWPMVYSVKPAQNAECTSCHRIGSLQGCEVWTKDAGGQGNYLSFYKTVFGRTYPQSHWMPTTDGGDMATEADWNTQMGPAHKAIMDCCNVTRADGSRILGKDGDFASMAPHYASPMPQSDIDTLTAAGCTVAPITEYKDTF